MHGFLGGTRGNHENSNTQIKNANNSIIGEHCLNIFHISLAQLTPLGCSMLPTTKTSSRWGCHTALNVVSHWPVCVLCFILATTKTKLKKRNIIQTYKLHVQKNTKKYWYKIWQTNKQYFLFLTQNKLHGLSSQANYTDWATALVDEVSANFFWIEGAAWSAQRTPTAVLSVFKTDFLTHWLSFYLKHILYIYLLAALQHTSSFTNQVQYNKGLNESTKIGRIHKKLYHENFVILTIHKYYYCDQINEDGWSIRDIQEEWEMHRFFFPENQEQKDYMGDPGLNAEMLEWISTKQRTIFKTMHTFHGTLRKLHRLQLPSRWSSVCTISHVNVAYIRETSGPLEANIKCNLSKGLLKNKN
jgi:hypothetical protein